MDKLVSIIENAIRAHISSVNVSSISKEPEIGVAIRKVMRENPDIFWFSFDNKLWLYSSESSCVSFRYTIDASRSEGIIKIIDDVVQNDFKLCFVRSLPVVEQVMYVYKWIALYCNYDIHSAHNQTIYSVFVHRHSVCSGIAKAAQYLLKLLGVESRLVFGKMNNSEKGSHHCWLVVNIEGQWYHLDPTFALPETEHLLHQCGVTPAKGDDLLFYNFFCIDTETVKQSRIIEDEERLPICNERIEYHHLHKLVVTPSRNVEKMGLGCMLSWSGTTADVYIAHHKNIHNRYRSVAKVYGNDPGHELLRKESLVMKECAGPHVLQSTYADFEKGILFMEQATPLSELLSSFYFKMTVKDFCDLLLDVCKGLQELRNHGIIYRDIHLNNIFLSQTSINGRRIYKLGDFGSCTFVEKEGKFAWLTEQGGIGSKWYMDPETWESLKLERLTHEPYFNECSAVYGVGMIAYYLLNELYPPFWNELEDNSFEARIHARQLPPPQLLIYSGLIKYKFDFVFKATKKEMADRYSSLDSLMTDIEVFKKHIPENVVIIDGALIRNSAYIDYRSDKRKGHTEDENAYDNSSIVEDYSASLERVPLNKYAYHPNAGFSAHEVHSSIFEPKPEALDYDNASVINKSTRTYPVEESFQQQNDNSTLIGDFASTMSLPPHCSPECSPGINQTFTPQSKSSTSFWSRIFGKKEKRQDVYSSVFSPAEVKPKSRMMVQVYLHLNEETEKVKALATEADKNAVRRNYIPLQTKLKKGDKVDVVLNINGDKLLYDSSKSIIWQGSFCKCAFDYLVPSDLDVDELSCSVTLYVNGAIVGEMLFYTQIVDSPAQLNANVIAKPVKKLFISYSHNDLKYAEKIAKLYEGMDVDVFFDKHRLKSGYIYSEEIFNFINEADTFVLCWSENAAQSEYVEKERKAALELAYPNFRPREDAQISIKPYNIQPYAIPPKDMIEHYHFEEL